MNTTEIIMVKVMCGSNREARDIAETLLGENLIACANIINQVESIFRWKGKVEAEPEQMLLMKTQRRHAEKILRRVVKLHSYDLPEISFFSVAGGLEDYFDWVREQTSASEKG